MTREVLTISVGQGGLQLGDTIWRQYAAEHDIQLNGKCPKPQSQGFTTFFEETASQQYVPRALCVDLETAVCDSLKNGETSEMYHPEFFLNGKEDAANNFARGHYTIGKELMPQIERQIAKLFDRADNVQGINVNHSVGGGTGSGLGMLILDHLNQNYRKKTKLGYEIYPSPNISTCIVEPYNALLSTHWLIENTDLSLVLDNEALYSICKKRLDIKTPTYNNLNRIISKMVSSMTASLRFDGELNVDMGEFQTNLVPFPRLHFLMSSVAPIVSARKLETASMNCKQITTAAVNKNSFLVNCEDFDPIEDKYMSILLNYRGNVVTKDINAASNYLREEEKVKFVDWIPTGFKIGICEQPVACTKEDTMAECKNSVAMVGNNIAISRVFKNRISTKFDMLYSERAYVHWYVGEGMEEGEFTEARENISFLEKDYADLLTEVESEEEQEE